MPKLTMSLAGLILTITVTCLGIFDLWCVLLGGTGSSISNFLINVGFKSPLVVLMVGVLVGHLFCYMTLSKS